MPALQLRSWPVAAGAAIAAAVILVAAARFQPAAAQLGKPPLDFPVVPDSTSAPAPQSVEVQALDGTHFVVVTREPRLARKGNQEGPWQNMLLTVVTHYTVQNERLIPVEHIRVPPGYRAYGQ